MTVSTRAVRRTVLLLATPWLPAGAQAETAIFESRLDPYVTQAVQDWRVPGLAIAVVRNDSVIMARGYGTREIGTSQPVDAGTRFAIGSTTKAMTAAALGILVDEGKLRWDDKVVTHLPSFRLSDPLVTRELTVRDLLTHRAGLPNADLLWSGGDYDTAEILRRIGSLPLAYSLRSSFIYQNIMYAAAGEVVAAVSGMPWEEFVRVRIFEPLGMRHTEPTLARLASQPNVATPHDVIDDVVRVVPNRPVDPVGAAGSAWSSVSDMARWIRFMLDSGRIDGRAVLTPATHRELLTSQVVAPPRMYATTALFQPHFFNYGLGWFLHDYRGAAVAMHTGSIDGMSAIVGLLPDHRAGVVVLANLDHAELRHALMLRVFDMVLEDARSNAPASRDWSAELLALYGQQREQARAAEERQLRARETGTRPSLPLEQYAGTYGNATFGDVVVAHRDGKLHLAFGNRRGVLEHWQHDTFRATWEHVRARPSLVTFAPTDSAGFTLRAFGNTFRRGGAAAGSATPRDYREPLGAPYRAENVVVPTPSGHALAGTLTLPHGASRERPVPAVVTITGSGPQDRDEALDVLPGYRPFRQFADSLGRRGIAVLRMDDRGTGASGGDHRTATSADFAEDIRAGLAYLRTRPEIDGARLGLVGHSEGGLIAPIVALQEPQLRALALLAGPSWDGRRILDFQLRNLARGDSSLSPARRDSALAAVPQRIDSLRASAPWMRFFIDHDVLATARQIRAPVLILNGGTDQQVTPEQAEELAAAIRSNGNTDVTTHVFPDMNHLFIYDPVGFPLGYTRLPRSTVEPEVVGMLVEWLVGRLR